jgi:hypothetical protein
VKDWCKQKPAPATRVRGAEYLLIFGFDSSAGKWWVADLKNHHEIRDSSLSSLPFSKILI